MWSRYNFIFKSLIVSFFHFYCQIIYSFLFHKFKKNTYCKIFWISSLSLILFFQILHLFSNLISNIFSTSKSQFPKPIRLQTLAFSTKLIISYLFISWSQFKSIHKNYLQAKKRKSHNNLLNSQRSKQSSPQQPPQQSKILQSPP